MTRAQRLLRSILALSALAFASSGSAEARSLSIQGFDAEIVVLRSGVVHVTETIRPRFEGDWNGLYRTIPIRYRTPQGLDFSLLLDVESVTDESGRPLRWESTREGFVRKIRIWIPGARDAARTVVLRYRVENALRFFPQHDELYWNVTGNEWDVPVGAAQAEILLPAGATTVRAAAFTGALGSRAAEADVDTDENDVRVRMRRPLAYREGLTVVVGWDKGAVEEPGRLRQAELFLRSNWPFAIPLAVFAGMLALWFLRGRDPRRRPVSVRYDPPDGLTPAEAGTLVDNRADMRDVTASIVDLAVRGYLKIHEHAKEGFFGLGGGKRHSFELRRPRSQWQDLAAHERALLDGLFSRSGALAADGLPTVDVSDLENEFYQELPRIKDAVFERLVERGYYAQRPDQVWRIYRAAGLVFVTAAVAAGATNAADAIGTAPLTLALAAAASGLVVVGFGWFMPARTLEGARVREGVLGFEEFLSRVEADRLDRTMRTPETFEKFLPYAMAFGVERKWVRAFENVYRKPPDWYNGGDPSGFQPRIFVDDLGRMSSTTAAAMASAPRSSGESGFSSGGGSSGGGFGGGGGGGF